MFEKFSFTTLGDLDHFITENSDEAYLLALSQLAFTDLDILSENIGVLNLCIVHTLKNGGGLQGLIQLYDIIYGPQETNTLMARLTLEQAMSLPFMQNHVQ